MLVDNGDLITCKAQVGYALRKIPCGGPPQNAKTTRGFFLLNPLVYVDDTVIQHLKDFVHQKFSSKDLGEIKFYLGIEILRSKDGFHLNQRKYALDLLA